MSYIPPFKSDYGITIPLTTQQIRNNLIEEITNINPDFTDLAGSPQNLLIDEATYILAYIQNVNVSVLSGLFPAYSNNWQLQNIGASVGLPQKTTQQLSVNVTFTGTIGTFIPQNTIVKNVSGDVSVITTENTTLSITSQEITCVTQIGSKTEYIAPNTLVVLQGAITGITSVNNSNAGYGLLNPESSTDYQKRVYEAFQLNKTGGIPQVLTSIKATNGVNPKLVSIRINSNGSINPIVGGGTNQDVATSIYTSALGFAKIEAVATTGSVVSTSIIDGGTTYAVSFVRPAINTLSLVVNFNIPSGVSIETFQNIVATAIVEYVNGLQVGQPLNTLSMYNYTLLALSNSGIVDIYLISALYFDTFLINGVATQPTLTNGNIYSVAVDGYFNVVIANIIFKSV